ncbi:MAG: hypothetical protein CMP11_02225 [Zetaproteobacteria bacterium]|nr:hypothetical protein [Pseudobdellovibrionaceae bacterium]
MATKKERQQLKAPDLLQIKAYAFGEWVQKNRKIVGLIGGALVVSVVSVLSWRYHLSNERHDRAIALSEIDQLYTSEDLAVEDKRNALMSEFTELNKEKKKLNEDLSELNSNDKKNDQLKQKIQKKTKELEGLDKKSADLIEKAQLLKADHTISQEKYFNFFSEHTKYPQAWRAGLKAASLLAESKEYTKAVEVLTRILEKAPQEDLFYQFQVRLFYINLLEEQSRYEEAFSETDKLLSLTTLDESQKSKALFKKGRLFMHSGNSKDAVLVFDQILNDYSLSAEAQQARAFKALL